MKLSTIASACSLSLIAIVSLDILLSASGTPWLVAWPSRHKGTDGITAALVSSDGEVVGRFNVAATDVMNMLAVGSHDNVWLLSWEDSGYIWACRIGQDGQVLDGTPLKVSSVTEQPVSLAVLPGPSGWRVVWGGVTEEGKPGTEFVELDLEGNVIRRDVLINGFPACSVASAGDKYFAVTVSGGGGDGDILGAYGSFNGGEPTQLVVCDAYNDQDMPVVVSNGSSWLIAWEDYRYDDEGVFLYGASADGTGAISNTQGTCISRGFENYSPAAASDGNLFLLSWVKREAVGENTAIAVALVSAPDAVSNPLTVKKLNCSYVSSPAVAFNGENYLVVWYEETSASCSRDFVYGIYGVRIDKNGKVLDRSPFLIAGPIRSPTCLSVASTWQLHPPSPGGAPIKPQTTEGREGTLVGEYVNPFNEHDSLQLFEGGTASLTVAGFYSSAEARWEKTDRVCKLTLADGTTLEFLELPFALVSPKPLLLPVIWLRDDAPIPSYSDVIGEYTNTTGAPEESLTLEKDGVFFMKEQGATGDMLEVSGHWSISGHFLTLKPEQTWYPEIKGVVGNGYAVFKGFYDVDVWKKEVPEGTSSVQEVLSEPLLSGDALQAGEAIQVPSLSLEGGFAGTEPLWSDIWLLIGPLIERQHLLEDKIRDMERNIVELQQQLDELNHLVASLEEQMVNLREESRIADMGTLKGAEPEKPIIAYVDTEVIFLKVFLPQVQAERQAMSQKQQEMQQLQAQYLQGHVPQGQYQQEMAKLQVELLQAQLAVDMTMLDKMIASPGFTNFRGDLERIKTQAQPLVNEAENLLQTAKIGILDMEAFQGSYRQLSSAFQQLDQLLIQVAAAKIVEISQQVGREGGYDLVLRKKDVLIYCNEMAVRDISDEVETRLRNLLSSSAGS